MHLCSEVAEYKIATGKAVYDAEREKQKIESVQAMAESEFNKQAVAELFLQMMTLEPPVSVSDHCRARRRSGSGLP
ncbi:MAG: chorismate mutase [Clostridium fessum]